MHIDTSPGKMYCIFCKPLPVRDVAYPGIGIAVIRSMPPLSQLCVMIHLRDSLLLNGVCLVCHGFGLV